MLSYFWTQPFPPTTSQKLHFEVWHARHYLYEEKVEEVPLIARIIFS